ncbi:MAG TPA: AMP-binding protein [Candidatus Coprenecus pullistercoris]|nr:AMP-binding protein [Candidatus Coprenecus pullistercoris]
MFLDLDKKPSDAPAVIDDSLEILTYGRLCSLVEDFGRRLPDRSLIIILASNTVGSMVGYLGCMASGVVPIIVNKDTECGQLSHMVRLYRPEYLWMPEADTNMPEGQRVFSAYGYVLVSTGLTAPDLHPDLALLLPTSGSTGSPKMVRHSLRNVQANARNVSELFGISPQDRAMAFLPMYYTMGLSVITSHLYSGATVLLTGRSMLDKAFWAMLRDGGATILTGVPYSFEILQRMGFFRMDLPALRIITQGGGRMSDSLWHNCVEYALRTGRQFIATYGQTEGTARMAWLPWPMAVQKVGSIGIAEPGGQLSVLDDSGVETFEGEAAGELVFRGENVTLGYAVGPKDFMKGDERGGVLHTGDIVRRDADGCHFIIGRRTRFLKIYGLRIALDEVEHIVQNAFPGTDCLCSGVDGHLVVHVTDGAEPENVRKVIVDKTGLFHKNIEVVQVESIERTKQYG